MTASRSTLAGAAFVGVALALSAATAAASPPASHGSQMFGWRGPAAAGRIGAFGRPFDRRFDGDRRGRRRRDDFGGFGFGGYGLGGYGLGDYGLGGYGLQPAVNAPVFVGIAAPSFYPPPEPFVPFLPPPGPKIIELRPPRPPRGPLPIIIYGGGP